VNEITPIKFYGIDTCGQCYKTFFVFVTDEEAK